MNSDLFPDLESHDSQNTPAKKLELHMLVKHNQNFFLWL